MLTLTIKKKWFDMIAAGTKKEEYRDIKDYYIVRFIKWLGFPNHQELFEWFKYNLETEGTPDNFKRKICFRNGYSPDAPELICECGLRIGYGKEEWGAEPGTKYFILEVKNIIEVNK